MVFMLSCLAAIVGYMVAGWSILESVYMLTITIFGVGYGEVRPIDSPRLCPLIPIDDHSCDSDVDHCEIVFDEFLVAGRDSSVLFDPADGAFNDVSLLVC